jgi:peptide/nickel transport system substrate-binding protein
MTVREGVTWHDGSPFTAEDVAWNLARVANPETGSPIQFVWGTLTNHRVEGNRSSPMWPSSTRRSSNGCIS